jgi:hypothetical protein
LLDTPLIRQQPTSIERKLILPHFTTTTTRLLTEVNTDQAKKEIPEITTTVKESLEKKRDEGGYLQ